MKFLIALLALSIHSAFAIQTGSDAPNFTLSGLNPKIRDITLSDFKGKIVVLEWLNYGCPFVKKHYGSGNMQALQKKYVEKDVIWLSIISSAPGKQGHVDVKEGTKEKVVNKSASTDVLLDSNGKVGKLFGAKTTPHMFIIDREGKIAYQGAIDDHADSDPTSIPMSKNYVAKALDEILSGKNVTVHTTKAYGCSVKY
jgi:hypothetical protein